jgi:hypothetical protein
MVTGRPLPHPVRSYLTGHRITLKVLADATGYSTGYTEQVISKRHPALPDFRAACSIALGVPESLLFDAADSRGRNPAGRKPAHAPQPIAP